MPLTDTGIRCAAPRSKVFKLFDSGGLYLEVNPAGGKWWRWKYRVAGKERRLSFGVYPEVSLKAARRKRDAARRQLADGIDPGQTRKAEKLAQAGAESFEVIAREWHDRFSPSWVKSHADRILRRLEVDVFPWLSERPIAGIKAPELLAVAYNPAVPIEKFDFIVTDECHRSIYEASIDEMPAPFVNSDFGREANNYGKTQRP